MSSSMWGYKDPAKVKNQMMEGMDPYLAGLSGLSNRYGERAQTSFDRSGELYGQSQQLLTGKGPILAAMRKEMRQGISGQAAQQGMQQNRALAARGMGGGGLSNILGAQNTAAAGEQVSKGLLGVQQYGLEAGKTLGGMASSWGQLGGDLMTGQGQAIGSGAQMVSQGNQAYVSQMQANAANKARYLQAEAARQRAEKARRSSGFGGLIGGIAGGIIGTAFGAPTIGASIGSSFGSSLA